MTQAHWNALLDVVEEARKVIPISNYHHLRLVRESVDVLRQGATGFTGEHRAMLLDLARDLEGLANAAAARL